MSEKRRGMRRTIFYYLTVLHGETEKPIGRLGDISEGGLLLITEDEDAIVGAGRIPAKIVLPPGIGIDRNNLSVTLQSKWSRQDKNPRYYLVGCSMEFNPDQQLIIEN